MESAWVDSELVGNGVGDSLAVAYMHMRDVRFGPNGTHVEEMWIRIRHGFGMCSSWLGNRPEILRLWLPPSTPQD